MVDFDKNICYHIQVLYWNYDNLVAKIIIQYDCIHIYMNMFKWCLIRNKLIVPVLYVYFK